MAERTPLHDPAARAGAAFAEEAGWLVPAHFGDPAGEYRRARAQAAVFDLSHHGKVEITGPEAVRFLHNLCTNDINGLALGTGCEAFLTTGQAKIVAHALVYRRPLPDGQVALWLDVGPGMGPKILQHLDHYLISEQLELADRTSEYAQMHVAGPRAREVVEQALPDRLPDLVELQHVERGLGSPSVLMIVRHDRLELPGYDLFCPTADTEAVWQALVAAGAAPAGRDAYELLRIEAGTPVNGVDIDESNLPQEVGRTERTVSFTKGCYIGQETVARIRTYGHVNRSLVGLTVAGDSAVRHGSKVYRDGKEVGQVTSSVISPRVASVIALAYVRRGNQEPGTTLEVETAEGRRSAEVVTLPFTPAPGPAPGTASR